LREVWPDGGGDENGETSSSYASPTRLFLDGISLGTAFFVYGVLSAPFSLSGVCGNAYGAVFDIGSGGGAGAEKRKNQIHKKYI